MDKVLRSGVIIDSEKFYKLLDWKDAHMQEFFRWYDEHVQVHKVTYSIQDLDVMQLCELVEYAGI